ncbi:hypothetical protein LTLLF_197375 [Microtus ochrogaster]|uniref:Uncharacterized protein n=1 Tax=Microtus ochrogaster TaxID=79684 RepID=A0A8J6KRS1_MICOH|nr:hypothetical protein LTLLF_197375 [Microtus ochrogaster]
MEIVKELRHRIKNPRPPKTRYADDETSSLPGPWTEAGAGPGSRQRRINRELESLRAGELEALENNNFQDDLHAGFP